MFVYIVLENINYTDSGYCGVYLTREKAENRVEEILKDNPSLKSKIYIEEEFLNE